MSIAKTFSSSTCDGLRQSVLLLVLSIGLAGCATSDSSSGQIDSRHLPTILNEVREHPEKRLAGEVACERSLVERPGDFPFKLFFAGLFDVHEQAAGEAFCAAIVEAVIAGDLTQSDLDAFKKPSAIRGKEPLGKLLRELMVAHERLYAQQAQKPPQAQSCGCGQ